MYNTAVYLRVNGDMMKAIHRKLQKLKALEDGKSPPKQLIPQNSYNG